MAVGFRQVCGRLSAAKPCICSAAKCVRLRRRGCDAFGRFAHSAWVWRVLPVAIRRLERDLRSGQRRENRPNVLALALRRVVAVAWVGLACPFQDSHCSEWWKGGPRLWDLPWTRSRGGPGEVQGRSMGGPGASGGPGEVQGRSKGGPREVQGRAGFLSEGAPPSLKAVLQLSFLNSAPFDFNDGRRQPKRDCSRRRCNRAWLPPRVPAPRVSMVCTIGTEPCAAQRRPWATFPRERR